MRAFRRGRRLKMNCKTGAGGVENSRIESALHRRSISSRSVARNYLLSSRYIKKIESRRFSGPSRSALSVAEIRHQSSSASPVQCIVHGSTASVNLEMSYRGLLRLVSLSCSNHPTGCHSTVRGGYEGRRGERGWHHA